MKIRNLFGLVICVTGVGCNSEVNSVDPNYDFAVAVTPDSSALELHQIPDSLINELRKDTLTMVQWQNIFSVVEEQNDPELTDLQPPLAGNYAVTHSGFVFTPAQKFIKGKQYRVEYYNKEILLKPTQMMRGNQQLFKQDFIRKSFQF